MFCSVMNQYRGISTTVFFLFLSLYLLSGCGGGGSEPSASIGQFIDSPSGNDCRIGSLMGAIKVAHQGPQNHTPTLDEIQDRFHEEFGYRF